MKTTVNETEPSTNSNDNHTTSTHFPFEICLVSGASGTGKSHLVNCALRHRCQQEYGGFFLTGKFQQQFHQNDETQQEDEEDVTSCSRAFVPGSCQAASSIQQQGIIGAFSSQTSTSATKKTTSADSYSAFKQALEDLYQQLNTPNDDDNQQDDWPLLSFGSRKVMPQQQQRQRGLRGPAKDSDKRGYSTIVNAMKTALGSEAEAFCQWSPGLHSILLNRDQEDSNKQQQMKNKKEDNHHGQAKQTDEEAENVEVKGKETNTSSSCSYARFAYLYRSLIFSLAATAPIVLFLDDLQWSDSDSLDLLKSIVASYHEIVSDRRQEIMLQQEQEQGNDEEMGQQLGGRTGCGGLLLVIAFRCCDDQVNRDVWGRLQNILYDSNNSNPIATNQGTREQQEKNMTTTSMMKMTRGNYGILTTEICIDCLIERDVNSLVSSVLELDSNEVAPLANLIHRKTGGNCFFVLQFLESLFEEKLITFSLQNYRWEWNPDLRIIQAKTDLSNNVVELVLKRVNNLNVNSRRVFRIMGLFGPRFDLEAITCAVSALENEKNKSRDNDDTNNNKKDNGQTRKHESSWTAINQLLSMGLIESGHDEWMKFTHDRIHEAAVQLNQDGNEKIALHLAIGQAMTAHLENPHVRVRHEDWFRLVRVDQLNEGSSILNHTQKADLALLNYHAALSVRAKSAFLPAAVYCETALFLLSSSSPGKKKHLNPWKHRFQLCLDLHMIAAECYGSCGKDNRCIDLATMAIENSRTLLDGTRARLLVVEGLSRQSRNEDAKALSFTILETLGERFPRKPTMLHVVRELVKTKLLLRKWSDQDLLNLPETNDERVVAMYKALKLLSMNLWFSPTCSLNVPLVWLRMVQVVLKHGMCALATPTFGHYAGLLCHGGDIEGSYRYGKLCVMHWERFGCSDVATPWVLLLYNQFCHHWRHPFHELMDPIYEAYTVGMRAGETQIALYANALYGYSYMMSGLSLLHVEHDLQKLVSQLKEYKNKSIQQLALPIWQTVLNYLGDPDTGDPTVLTGKAMNESILFQEAKDENNGRIMADCWGYKVRLGICFGDNKQAFECFKRILSSKNELVGHFGRVHIEFLGCLAAVALARSTRKRKYKRLAIKVKRKFERWTKGGAVNCLHMLLLIRAEVMSLKRDYSAATRETVRRTYDEAIQSAGRAGFCNHDALAREKAGIYHFDFDEEYARIYIAKAYERYIEWGAGGKADHLAKQFPFLRETTARRSSSSFFSLNGIKARRRHQNEIFEQHKRINFW